MRLIYVQLESLKERKNKRTKKGQGGQKKNISRNNSRYFSKFGKNYKLTNLRSSTNSKQKH